MKKLLRIRSPDDTYLVLCSSDGLREAEEGQSEVDEAVLVGLHLLVALHELGKQTKDILMLTSLKERMLFTLMSSRQTRPTMSDVVVAIAGMILPAMPFV